MSERIKQIKQVGCKAAGQLKKEFRMSQNNALTTENKPTTKHSLSSGLILVGIGAGLLLMQFIDMAMYIPILIALVFLVAGLVTRNAGLFIPSGIIGGVGLGVLSTVYSWFFPTNSVESGGVFLLFFASGWFSIPLLSRVFSRESNLWALIPGAVMAAIGGLILAGQQGLHFLEIAGKFWPVILMVIGLVILIGWWKEHK